MIYNLHQSLNRILNKFKIENIIHESYKESLQISESKNKLMLIGDIEENFDLVIDTILGFIVKNKYEVKFHVLSCMQEIENLRHDYHRNIWMQCSENKKILDDILKDKNFMLSDRYILYKKRIMVEHVIYKDKCYSLSKEFIKKTNIFLDDIKIFIYKIIISILACGNHPNLNSSGGEYCFDSKLGLMFNYNNLNLVLNLCKIANLDNCYNFNKNILIYNEVIK